MAVFYVLFGLWWVGILSWLAYKMGLFSKCCDPKDLPKIDEEVDVDGVKRSDALVCLAYRIGNKFSRNLFS